MRNVPYETYDAIYFTLESTFCKEKNNNIYADPNDCGNYIACTHSFSLYITCPNGLHYDPNTQQCTDPRIAGCDISFKSKRFTL